ncbi:hypothetical protein [Novosphingobium sp. KACC 22771]|uniref:hypothetical protein n=1 Tax=Novosphingobium sp. KACC 22771 TaxID=3025670 RepID=UPI00236524F6|nr:hypothetical protein [Novosphingobium sp. KACC 22771]WDF72818.1 hypothetical protein PQ467_01895 [Novosphingobium sp. KACC 22771]
MASFKLSWLREGRGESAASGRGFRLRIVLVLLGLGAFVALGLGLWKGPRLAKDALTGAAFGARIACSCRFVEGRPLDQCRSDFEPGMGMVMLSADESAKSVTARVPLIAAQTATLRPGEGCVLEKWER